MNWVDLVVIAVIVFSGLLALMRGLVREVLSIAAWLGAGVFAWWAFPFVQERFRGWIGNPDFADPAAYVCMFLVALVFLSIVAGMVGSVVRQSALGGIDRSLGLVFGILRGAAIIVVAYILCGLIAPPDRWPPVVLAARSLPLVYEGAQAVVQYLPADFPAVKLTAPPAGPETRAEDLLQSVPQGYARARTASRP